MSTQTKPSSTITSKGQTTIPKEIREKMGLQPHDKIEFSVMSTGAVMMRAKKTNFHALYGLLHDPERPAITAEDMQPK